MKKTFRSKKFNPESLVRVTQCNDIIDRYMEAGLRLTLRQLYYQLVSKNIIPNSEKSYKGLGGLVSDARLAGLMDWSAIEDRVRVPRAASEFTDLSHLADSALRAYRLPRWKGQMNYVELCVEKDALAGVLWPLAHRFHVTLMVNRGYSSQSAMYETSLRFKAACASNGGREKSGCRAPLLLYLGDHDPSGEDMVRDIEDRLQMFGVAVLVKKVALTMDQIEEYDPPPNPAKVTDPRAAKYIEKHGDQSWEVDALPPEVLSKLIEDEFASVIDEEALAPILAKEESDKKRLRDAVAEIMEGD